MSSTSVETWRFINTFAPWFSALGTFSAVIVSLYLARSRDKVKLKIRAGEMLIITPGIKPSPKYLGISVTNVGSREVTVTGISWKVGRFKKDYFFQMVSDQNYSSKMPAKLNDGEEAKYFIPLEGEDNWLDRIIQDVFTNYKKSRIKTFRLQIFTSIGKIFESKISDSLQKKLFEKYDELKK